MLKTIAALVSMVSAQTAVMDINEQRIANRIFELTNRERSDAGLQNLQFDNSLQSIATTHADGITKNEPIEPVSLATIINNVPYQVVKFVPISYFAFSATPISFGDEIFTKVLLPTGEVLGDYDTLGVGIN